MTRGWLTTVQSLTKTIGCAMFALTGALSSFDCNAASHVVECERLHHYSCECFTLCQTDDRIAFNSDDAATCTARLRQDFMTWQVCASGVRPSGQRCDAVCMQGWGTCAFEVYGEAGLPATNPCEETGG
jgi:hypothetical protein